MSVSGTDKEGSHVADQDDDDTTTTAGVGDGAAGVAPEGDAPQGQEDDGQDPAAPKPAPAPRPAPPGQEWKPPSKEEWDKVTAGLRDASGEAATRKKRLRELEAQLEELKLASATAEERAAKELEKRVLQEADAKWRPKAAAAEAKAALVAAGCKDPARWAKLIDLSRIEFGDDGEVTGADEQAAAIKADYPEAFKRERPAPPELQAAQPGSTRGPATKKTATERQVAALLGKP